MAPDDFRRTSQPRFERANLDKNLLMVDKITRLANVKGCTSAQLALAWILAQGDHIIPIPGTRTERYVDENIAAAMISLTKTDLDILNQICEKHEVIGERYTSEGMSHLNL